MIDIHTHILPNLDDGSENLEESCMMAEMAVRSGVTALIATPHSNDEYGFKNEESNFLQKKFDEFRAVLQAEQIPLAVYRGMEIWSSADIPEKIQSGRLLSLNHSRYVLVEFAFTEETWWFDAVIQKIVEAGMTPIIAHPERYFCVQETPELIREWRQSGAYTQMNKGSILGKFGNRAAHTAETLLHKQLYTFIASDAHHCDVRTTDLRELIRYLEKYHEETYWTDLLEENPLRVLQNRKIQNEFCSWNSAGRKVQVRTEDWLRRESIS